MKIFKCLCSMLVLTGFIHAESVILQWDPNTEPELAGYRLFRSNSSLLKTTVDQAMADSGVGKILVDKLLCTVEVTGLDTDSTYYFRLTAIDTSGNQSGFNVDSSGNPAEVVVNPQAATAVHELLNSTGKISSRGVLSRSRAVFGPDALSVTILDIRGRIVYKATRSSPSERIIWDYRDNSGNAVVEGTYVARIGTGGGASIVQRLAVVRR